MHVRCCFAVLLHPIRCAPLVVKADPCTACTAASLALLHWLQTRGNGRASRPWIITRPALGYVCAHATGGHHRLHLPVPV